jgi:hypothetical protein
MRPKPLDLVTLGWQSEAILSFFLFLQIVFGFVLPSVGFENNNLPLYGDIVFSVVLVFGSAVAWGDRRLFVLTSLVAIVAIVVRWLAWWTPTKTLLLWSLSTGLLAVLTITAVLLWRVFRPGPATVMRVEGAIAAYICIGGSWAHAYHIAAWVDPSAFTATGSNVSLATTWVNHSFGILTTLGYAGIVPASPLAHTLGSAEAMTG